MNPSSYNCSLPNSQAPDIIKEGICIAGSQQPGNIVTIIARKLNVFIPPTTNSINWQQWITALDGKTCKPCLDLYGKIYSVLNPTPPLPPLHPRCRCTLVPLPAVAAGAASHEGTNGADWWLKYYKMLPPYYLNAQEYDRLGWKKGQPPSHYAPGKMMTGGIYMNKNDIYQQPRTDMA